MRRLTESENVTTAKLDFFGDQTPRTGWFLGPNYHQAQWLPQDKITLRYSIVTIDAIQAASTRNLHLPTGRVLIIETAVNNNSSPRQPDQQGDVVIYFLALTGSVDDRVRRVMSDVRHFQRSAPQYERTARALGKTIADIVDRNR